jgi:hypothetical protein
MVAREQQLAAGVVEHDVAAGVPGRGHHVQGAAAVTLDYPPLRHANSLGSVLTYEGTSEVRHMPERSLLYVVGEQHPARGHSGQEWLDTRGAAGRRLRRHRVRPWRSAIVG